MHYRRHSWLDSYKEMPVCPGVTPERTREYAIHLDEALYDLWQLGENILLAWAPTDGGILVLRVHHYDLVELESADGDAGGLINEIMAGDKLCAWERLFELADIFDTEPERLELPFTPGEGLDERFISEIIKRYGITLVKDRAVALIDAVGFSLYSPIQQVTQLNSLSFSANSAYSKLLSKDIDIAFARSTTGDGFYLWNRSTGIDANLELFQFLVLILADNAIALSKARNHSVPRLRACFHVGSHYEFYQEEALSPTRFSYLVGDVTIELARMIDKARPGQFLVGEFSVRMHTDKEGRCERIDSAEFIRRSRQNIFHLDEIELSGDSIESIKCYLTGPKCGEGEYGIDHYEIEDKHGLKRGVYNAKITINRHHHEPLYIGIRSADMDDFGTA